MLSRGSLRGCSHVASAVPCRTVAPPSSNLKSWFEHAWGDWLGPVALLVVAVAAYVLYHFDLVSERLAGGTLIVVIVAGVVGMGVVPALPLTRTGTQRVMVALVAVLAVIGAGWPTLRIALDPKPLAAARFTADQTKVTVQTGSDGPYEFVVSGRFRQAGTGDVEASYNIKVEGTGTELVQGALKRSTHRYRTSRRGGTSASLEEHTELVHRVNGVSGGTLTLSVDGVDEQLNGELDVAVRAAGPRPEIFWGLCGLALLIRLILDSRMGVEVKEEDRVVRGPKREQTYLTVVAAMMLVFSINFPMEATPRSLVRAAVGAFFLALLAGGAGGWLLASFARLATRPRRRS